MERTSARTSRLLPLHLPLRSAAPRLGSFPFSGLAKSLFLKGDSLGGWGAGRKILRDTRQAAATAVACGIASVTVRISTLHAITGRLRGGHTQERSVRARLMRASPCAYASFASLILLASAALRT